MLARSRRPSPRQKTYTSCLAERWRISLNVVILSPRSGGNGTRRHTKNIRIEKLRLVRPPKKLGFDDQLGRSGRTAEHIPRTNRPDARFVVDGKREQLRRLGTSNQQISRVMGNCVALRVDGIEMDHVERGG